jgi:glutaredoxin
MARPDTDELRVYWQPGCTSCLRVKELLAARGVPFTSIDVLADARAMDELRALGARSVPVVARGDRFVYGQEPGEVARFVGLALESRQLEPEVLVMRLERLLATAARLAAAIPAARIHDTIPSRPRRYADIAFHVGMIVEGFLDAARGGELRYEHFERRPAAGAEDPATLAAGLLLQRAALLDWAARDRLRDPARSLRTYYGERPLHAVLERTAWHVAQHCRQLDHLVGEVLRVGGAPRLPATDLEGLPVPREVWDPEVRFA